MSRRFLQTLFVALAAWLSSAGAAGAQVLSLTLEGGRVTLNAEGVSVAQILKRWADVGRVTVVNGDKLGDAPVTLQLVDIPEQTALATILRSAGGYMLGRRQGAPAGQSIIDRILILPTSSSSVALAQASVPAPARLPDRPPDFGARDGEVFVDQQQNAAIQADFPAATNSLAASPQSGRPGSAGVASPFAPTPAAPRVERAANPTGLPPGSARPGPAEQPKVPPTISEAGGAQ
jgi:hypothetical protein